jgi:hypothetical protein
VQATSVPCERAFSSSKETITARRNRMSTDFMEELQILKTLFRSERLDHRREEFIIAADVEDAQDDFSPEYIDELVGQGRIDELLEVMKESQNVA